MLQYVLTALAGIALGVVGLRIWQSMQAGALPDAALQGKAPQDGADQGPPVGDDAAAAAASGVFTSRRLLIGAGALVAAAVAILMFRSPETSTSTSNTAGPALTGSSAAAQPVGDVDSMITRLADRLKQNPGDGEGFRMLGWSYLMTGHPDKAIEPYKRALQLLPRNASAHAGYGEAMVAVAGGRVTDEAKAALERAVAIEPGELRARYFMALWQAQNGQQREALDKWVTLANQAPADALLRHQVRAEIKKLHRRLRDTIIYVTHDQVEAMTLADRIVVLRAGRIVQVGTPDEIYHWPSHRFVAEFTGSPPMNLVPAAVVTVALVAGDGAAPLQLRLADGTGLPACSASFARDGQPAMKAGQALLWGIRPEAIVPADAAPADWPRLALPVSLVEPLGAENVVHLTLGQQEIAARFPGKVRPEVDAVITVAMDPTAFRYYDTESGVALTAAA